MEIKLRESSKMTSITGHQHRPPRLLPCLAIHVVLLLLLLLGIQLPYSLGATYRNETAVPLPAASGRSCLPDQASALLQLKLSFFPTNESATAFRSWRAASDCCSWEGVGCDADGRVTALDLGGCGLKSGGLHLALFNLTSLRHLNLGGNNFSSSQLPAVGFERLTQLTNLNLSSSNFQGLLPVGIGRLTKLVILDLSSRFKVIDQYDEYLSIADPWPLILPSVGSLVANLSNLEELHLGTVDLSENGAVWCRDLANSTPRLQVLSLPDCYLSGPICGSLSAIPSLTVVNLQYNALYGPIPEPLADLPSLSVLTLTANHLEGWLPTRIFHNRNLTSIDIRYNFGLSGLLPNFSENSILTDLLVSSTGFSGPIPSSISNLRSLNKLGVAAGDFSQELPSSIGQLRSLGSLEITGAVVGAIPSWITNLTSLVMLQFSNCGLSGEVPSYIGSLKNLTRLQLYKCNFSGRIPPQIFNLTQLQALYLQSNNFHGVVKLSSFWKLRSLFSLNLSNNKLTVLVGGEDNYSMVSQMYSLGLASCNISKFPDTMKHMHHLSYLDLSDNQIHGSIPEWAWETWSGIRVLNISHNKINQLGASYVPPGNIQIMDLSSNLFEGPVPIPGSYTELLDCSDNRFSSIPLNFGSQLSNLLYLKASRNSLSGRIPPSICDARSLKLLDLSYNILSGSIPSCLMEDINSLNVLNLKGNQLQGKLPQNIKNSCAIEALDVSDNSIEGKLPRSLAACRDLQVVDMGNNQITDAFPCWMSMLPKLQVLVLKSNKFNGKVGQKEGICEFGRLRVLDLASNNFSGTLSNEWLKTMISMMAKYSNDTMRMEFRPFSSTGPAYQFTSAVTYKGYELTFSNNLNTLVVIDVSDNAFQGVIPKSIGELDALNGVNMSHNALSGPIPSHFGALHKLESLDLSSNDLSGEIPQELASLDFLSTLNLSYNKLVGRIPDSPHFLTFSNLSFLGNIGLCGLQVSKACHNITPNVDLRHSEEKSVDIILFLFSGLGFGIGFAVAIVVRWGIHNHVRRRSQGNIIFMCWKKVLAFI